MICCFFFSLSLSLVSSGLDDVTYTALMGDVQDDSSDFELPETVVP